ncbi:MAG TPA: hypothetical protein VK427_23775, partial [Kofleriaceae bacterium]|nr:hypothetical protein [Kofleriaceae bacterium]
VESGTWTAANVMELGAPMIAARLDGCEGKLARDATHAPIVVPTVIEDDALAARGRTQLLASRAARAAEAEWRANDREGDWRESEFTSVSTRIVRHPTTNETWVSAHARIEEGCGAPDINIWGLYRVVGSTLVAVQERNLGELWSIDQLVDLEGDGTLELVGAPWLENDVVIVRANGDEVSRLELPFFGCAC